MTMLSDSSPEDSAFICGGGSFTAQRHICGSPCDRGDEKPHVRSGFNHDIRHTFAITHRHANGSVQLRPIQSP